MRVSSTIFARHHRKCRFWLAGLAQPTVSDFPQQRGKQDAVGWAKMVRRVARERNLPFLFQANKPDFGEAIKSLRINLLNSRFPARSSSR